MARSALAREHLHVREVMQRFKLDFWGVKGEAGETLGGH